MKMLMGLLSLALALSAQMRTIPMDPAAMKTRAVKVEKAAYKGKQAIRASDADPAVNDAGRFAYIPGPALRDGVIEIDMSGALLPTAGPGSKGFVGIAFRVDPDEPRFECYYLRPVNGRIDDQVMRNHSIQYISIPGFPWQKLREEFPWKYESYADLVPGEWNHVKVEFQGEKSKIYVNRMDQPAMIVNDMKQPVKSGGIALWVGPGTLAHFADLKVSAQ